MIHNLLIEEGIGVQNWTYILVGVTFAIYIGIAIWSRAGSTKEFYVAGGGVSPLANGMATAADWMSAASFISMAGKLQGLSLYCVHYLCLLPMWRDKCEVLVLCFLDF